MARIFFAVNVSEEIKTALTKLYLHIPADQKNVKWVTAKNLHLTLQFIGDVDEFELGALLARAPKAAKLFQPFALDVCGLGVFPNPSRPRIIWAGIKEGKDNLTNLAQELSCAIDRTPDKPFAPHITLGRVRQGHKVELRDVLETYADTIFGKMTVDRFACVESTLTPQGPVYRLVKEFKLG